MILDHHLDQLGSSLYLFIQDWIAEGLRRSRKGLMTNKELIGVIHNMDWIIKHMQNKDDTGVVKAWSSDQKLFQAKVDRQLADDFRVISIALGQSQKKLVEDWMAQFVSDFKRGALS